MMLQPVYFVERPLLHGDPVDDGVIRRNFRLCRAVDMLSLGGVLDEMVAAGMPEEQAACFRASASALLTLMRTENNRLRTPEDGGAGGAGQSPAAPGRSHRHVRQPRVLGTAALTTCPYCDPDTRYVLAGGPCVCAPWTRVEHLAPGVTLYCGDSLDVLPALVGRHDIASCVTDPPYGLGEHPDPRELLRCWLEGRPYVPRGKGFMGKDWDAFVPGPEIWRPVMDLLPPGAHMLAAFGTRTYDIGTLAVRLADAEIRDLVAWLYGSGFPKSLDVSKAIDKAAGAERAQGGPRLLPNGKEHHYNIGFNENEGWAASAVESRHHTLPATDAARQWEGWGTALKPALEPWVLARKPLSGTVAANVQAHGVGALNIDACRVGTGADKGVWPVTDRTDQRGSMAGPMAAAETDATVGRWPANVIHDGSDEVLAGFPDAKGQQGDLKGHAASRQSPNGVFGTMAPAVDHIARGDSGSASRFFYCAKASKRDRDEGMEGAEDAVLARSGQVATRQQSGNTVTSEGGGFNAARIVKNNHPTVKPEGLMSYLARLITPPGRIVLDPFMGSGSTGKAAVRAGFGFVGIERDPEYFEIAVRRIRNALATGPGGG